VIFEKKATWWSQEKLSYEKDDAFFSSNLHMRLPKLAETAQSGHMAYKV